MRKGQIETGEMIMVMLIVMIFLIMGFVAYSNFKSKGVEDVTETLESLEAIDLAQEAAGMQELSCSLAAEESGLCMDTYKLNILGDFISQVRVNSREYNYYRNKFGQAVIIVEKIYPGAVGPADNWVIYNNTPEDFSGATPLRIPVQLYDPVSKRDSFGIMTVVKYT